MKKNEVNVYARKFLLPFKKKNWMMEEGNYTSATLNRGFITNT